MSIPLPVIVNVWAAEPTFATASTSPFFTVRVEGVNTKPPDPCWRVTPPAALGEPPDGGLELLLQAAPSSTSTPARQISGFALRRTRIWSTPFPLANSGDRILCLSTSTGDGQLEPRSSAAVFGLPAVNGRLVDRSVS